MKMIIGGAFQGKAAFAEKTMEIRPEEWADGGSCGRDELFTCRGIRNFHLYVRRALAEGWDADALPEQLEEKNPGVLIVTNELGYGIVPMDPEERTWRETDGRLCARLAAYADEVWRVTCGIGQRLK